VTTASVRNDRIPWRTRPARWAAAARPHWLIAVLLLAGTALRVVVTLGFRPIIWYIGDSISYLGFTVGYPAVPFRPAGYSFFLFFFRPFHRISLIAVGQHALGIMIAILMYVICYRIGLSRPVSALATLPFIFDAWEITSEQTLLSETLFIFLFMISFTLVLWRNTTARMPVWIVGLSGVLIGADVSIRTVAGFLVIPFLLLLLVRRQGMIRIALGLGAFLLPVVAYAGYFDSQFGWFGLSTSGRFEYGHVAPFANCKGVSLTAEERTLCPTPAEQKLGRDFFWWDPRSPFLQLKGGVHHADLVARSFAEKIILHQPGDYASAVWKDLHTEFNLNRGPSVYDVSDTYRTLPSEATFYASAFQHGPNGQTHPSRGIANFFAHYQRHVFVPGLAFLAGLIVSGVAIVFGRKARSQALWDATMALGLTSFFLLLVPPVTVTFDYRYWVPALPPLCVATVAGIGSLVRRFEPAAHGASDRPDGPSTLSGRASRP
jgi:hypothetical protein